MAFGFVIERFNLFLQVAAREIGAAAGRARPSEMIANLAGLAFIGIGVVMIVVAGFRLVRAARGH